MRLLTYAFCLALLASGSMAQASGRPPATTTTTGQCDAFVLSEPFPLLRVVDGDTLWILCKGRVEKLRLLSVDTEEREWLGEASAALPPHRPATRFGEETALFAESLIKPGQLVRLATPREGPGRDAFGRLLCHVLLADGVDFNLLLVSLGMSPYYNKYGQSRWKHAAFLRAETSARCAQLGIWSPSMRRRPRAPAYSMLRPWWSARAEAVADFEAQLESAQAFVAASDAPGLLRAWQATQANPEQSITVFGSVQRFYEEQDGSLTALMHSGEQENPLRLVLPSSLRDSDLERTLRHSQPSLRQNYLYLSGRLSLGERGLSMLAQADSHWRPAGPEPRFP